MVVAGLSPAISISISTATRTPSCFHSRATKPPSSFLGLLHSPHSNLSISARRNRYNASHCCRCSLNSNDTYVNWDWNRWCRYFSEIEQAENFASVLKFQLDDAIEKEDFEEAIKLKRALLEATSKDTVAQIMDQLKSAIDDERYHDASRLCKCTGSGLMGWWVGYSKTSDDPFGRIIHISPGMGRFIGKSYSPRQLMTASSGTPTFEIYVVKNADDTYHMQVVYLRQAKGKSKRNPLSISAKGPSKPEVNNVSSSVEVQADEEKVERNDEKNNNIEAVTEEGIKSVINFLKEKIPGLKVKVMNVNVEEEAAENNDSIQQLMEEDSNKTGSGENHEDEVDNLDEPDGVTLDRDEDATEEEKDLEMKLFIGGVVHNNEDTPVKDDFIRLPAVIKNMEKDSFVFNFASKNLDYGIKEDKAPNIKVAALAAQGVSELMPPDVANAFWSSDKVSSKMSKSMRDIVRVAMSQAHKRTRLSGDTYFNRITCSRGDSDPFDGLYVGAFGPYGMEIVHLRRKFGHWNEGDSENTSDVGFFEYVEAVKLTGDLNVPAGQVTFRAKIGRGNRNTNRGMYPDDLGVVASYKGQGRIADYGFRNPKWVEGELLQLNGKGMGPYMKGADLGFLYVVPEQSFLVLFHRLKLPE